MDLKRSFYTLSTTRNVYIERENLDCAAVVSILLYYIYAKRVLKFEAKLGERESFMVKVDVGVS